MFFLRVVLAATAFAVPLAAAAGPNLSDGELQMFVWQSAFPVQCGSAQSSVREMRVDPTTDPTALHAMAQTFIACADTPYAANAGALFNASVFAGAAASLLAARHETGAAALGDAENALKGAQLIAGYTRGTNAHPGSSKDAYVPSMLVTDAGRIGTDAQAVIAALGGTGAGRVPVTFPATPAPGAGW